jgi:hypothetical protein
MSQPLFHLVAAVTLPTHCGVACGGLSGPLRLPVREADTPQFAIDSDPWSLVDFAAYSDPATFESQMPAIGKRALFIILVTEKMADDPAWADRLNILANALPKKSDQGTRNALCFASSEEAQQRLPGRLRERQAPESSVLGAADASSRPRAAGSAPCPLAARS